MDRQDSNAEPENRCGTDPLGEFIVEDHGDDLVVFATLPGFDPNDLVLEVKDGVLLVDALHVENNRRFSHRVPLPTGVPPGPVRYGTFINGALEVRLPKRPPVGR